MESGVSVFQSQIVTLPTFEGKPVPHFASLGMLMLPSCEPGDGNSDAGNVRPRDERGRALEGMVPDEAGNAQLAAQDSVGKPPPPRHLAPAAKVLAVILQFVFTRACASKSPPRPRERGLLVEQLLL
jgi:hypothetical protein